MQKECLILVKEIEKDGKKYKNFYVLCGDNKPVAIKCVFDSKVDRYILNNIAYNYDEYENIKRVPTNN